MQTLSKKHPLHEWLASVMRMRTAQNPHQINLENILQQFPQMTEDIETIESYIPPPLPQGGHQKWKSRSISQKTRPKTNTTKCKTRNRRAQLYTQTESGIKSKIGAVIYDETRNEIKYQHFGKNIQYNVYTAELAALQLAIELLWYNHERIEWRIFIDSQSAIKVINKSHRKFG